MFWQRTHRRRMEELIRSAKTDFPISQEYVERVTAGIEGAPPTARGRSRRKLVAIAAGVVVALVGLGFVPFPMGSAKGALDRALAATENATTVHVRSWMTVPAGSTTAWGETAVAGGRIPFDEWVSESEEGFYRWERRSESEYSLTLAVGPWEVIYQEEGGKPTFAYEMYDPCYLHPADMPDRGQFLQKFDLLRYLAEFSGRVGPRWISPNTARPVSGVVTWT